MTASTHLEATNAGVEGEARCGLTRRETSQMAQRRSMLGGGVPSTGITEGPT